jgi:hypothetical protein
MFTLSLGATCLGPPRTCGGTIVKPAAAAAVALRKLRRVVVKVGGVVPVRGCIEEAIVALSR